MKILHKEFPILRSNKNSKIMEWQIAVYDCGNYAEILTTYGYQNSKKTIVKVDIYEGKNIGKRNETTYLQQAEKEAQSKWDKKNEQIVQLTDSSSKFIQPMLASKFDKNEKYVQYFCFAQSKLDGVRCISIPTGDILFPIFFQSRTGKEYHTLGLISNSVMELINYVGCPIDGEIYRHDIDFENICSAVRNNKPTNTLAQKLQYWVYDIVDTTCRFDIRYSRLRSFFIENGVYDEELKTYVYNEIILCPTVHISNKEDLLKRHKEFVDAGYEGTIIRNSNGYYNSSKTRSKNLQKLKDFSTDEFTIVDVIDGVGSNCGLAIFTCKTKDGKLFNVTPEASHRTREYMYDNKDLYIGKMLTVKYQCFTKYGIPKFANGLAVRDYE